MRDIPLAQIFKSNHLHPNLYCVNTNHAVTHCNDIQAKAVNLECERDLVGKYVWDVYSKSVSKEVIINNDRLFRSGIGEVFNELTELNDGTIVTYASYKYPARNPKGKIIGLIGMSVAISSSKKNKCDLSPQQEKCLQFLLQGLISKEIAEKMQLSHRTIEHYIASTKLKLNCRSTRKLILKFGSQIY